MENEMIERVARALHAELAGGDPDELIHHPSQKSWETPTQRRWEEWAEAAGVAIEAMREPTEAMAKAASRNAALGHLEITNAGCECVWKEMIDAALTPSKVPQTAS